METVVHGLIKDTKGEELAGIMVVVKNTDDNAIAYAISNGNGFFTLTYPTDSSNATVVFSCLGFKTLSIPIEKIVNNGTYILEDSEIELKEVTVRNPPIASVGDTLIYDVNAFKNASDRSIEDVIRKLPGIKVEDNGRILYNGEAINKFYIEGLDLLSGRYALASQNISADDVSSVSIYENHQPKRVLQDIEFSENAAINLKLKKKSVLRPIGYIKAGGGGNDHGNVLWLGEAFSLLISPKTQVLLSAKGNEAGITYINETQNLIRSNEGEPTYAFNVYPEVPFGKADIPSARFYDNRSVSASANAITRINEYRTLTFSADYADELNRYENSSAVTYTLANAEETTISENVNNRPHSREAKFKVKFENNEQKKYLTDELSFTGHFNSDRYAVISDRHINQINSTKDYNLHNHLNGILSISRYILNFKSDIQFSTTPLNSLNAKYTDGTSIVMQDVKGNVFRTREEIGYSWLLNRHSSISATLTFNLAHEVFKSFVEIPSDVPANDIRGFDIATAIEPKYQYKFTNNNLILELSVPVRIRNLKLDNILTDVDYTTNRVDVDFKASLHYKAPFNLRTVISAGRTNSLGSISDYLVNPIYTTFREQNTLGSGLLGQRTSYFATSNFNYRNVVEGLFSTASLLYRTSTSNRLGSLDVDDGNITNGVKNIDNRSHILSAAGSFSKKVYKWSTLFGFDGNYELMKRAILRQSMQMDLRLDSYTLKFIINSNPIKDYLILDTSIKYSRTSQRLMGLSDAAHTDDLTGNIRLATHPIKNLELSFSSYFSHNRMANDNNKNSVFLDCGARYSIDHFDIDLTARNLSNTKQYSYSFMSDSNLYTYSFTLRPFEILMSVKYSY